MININNHYISAINVGNKTILFVYKGPKLLWEAINSCFGSGTWTGDKVWRNDNTWRND